MTNRRIISAAFALGLATAVTTWPNIGLAQDGASAGRPLGILIDRRSNPFSPDSPPQTKNSDPQPIPQITDFPATGTFSGPPLVGPAPRGRRTVETPTSKNEPPVNLLADEMSFDREKGVISARGNVEITFAERTLLADQVDYNQNTDIVTAAGNVTIVEPSGETLFAEQVTLTGDLKEGLVRNIGIILADRSRLVAHGAKRSGGLITELRQGVYSPCNLCADDPEKAPLWQIKAVRVIHDKRTKTIEYRDAWLEVHGIPVAYLPYFMHPDPTVKRKAGFMAPSFGGSSDLGFVARTPYFYPINRSQDVTVTPSVSGEEGFLLALDYRGRFAKGKLDTQISGINDSKDDFRGHIATEGRFDLNRTWRAGFDINRTTDDTYLRRFGFDSPAVLETRLFAEGFRGRNYLAVNGFSFQDLRDDADSIDSPIVLPLVEFSHIGAPDRFGGSFAMDANFLVVNRDDSGNDTRRVSLRPSWNRRFSDSVGNLVNFSAGVFADGYHANDVARGNGTSFTGVTGRVLPYASLEWRFPLVSELTQVRQTLEPIAQIITSPNGSNPTSIPNEDSQEFEFDDTNLFDVNRFGGIDRVEGGTRVNYGLKWGLFGPTGGNMTILVGQTYRFAPDDTFGVGSGLEDDLSDVVAAVVIRPNSRFDMNYRTQLEKDGFAARRHQLQVNGGVPLLSASANYFFFEKPPGSEFTNREELSFSMRSQLSRNWRTNFNLVRDLAADEMRSISTDLIYENECIVVSTRFSRTFFVDRDLEPTDAFTINLLLKTLGQISF